MAFFGRVCAIGLVALIATAGCAEEQKPVRVDTTAVYRNPSGQEMKFEVSSSGMVRAKIGASPTHVVIRDGEAYVVQTDAQGPVAVKASDMATVMRFRGVQTPTTEADYVESGEKTVNGREGRAVFVTISKDKLSPRPMFVMSDDPQLATLGQGVAKYYEASISLTGADPHSGFKKSLNVLSSGTPLTMFGYFDLASVDHKPISSERFSLPRIASQGEVFKMMSQPTQ